ncbi:MAG: RnfABCDGE type electron transport complex subunit G [Candidatus Omnitrophota bacterium]
MRKIIQIIVVLSAVSFISGACLVFVYSYTQPRILENQKKEVKEAIFKVFPGAASYETVNAGGMEVFLTKDAAGKQMGYAFIAKGNGYQGEIKLMAAISADLKTILGIEILESQETPGLGQEITSPNFRKQFMRLATLPEIICVKGEKPDKPNEIEAITGATISSRAVVSILNDGVKQLKENIK